MFVDLVARFLGDGLCKNIQIITLEEGHLSTILTEQQVLMSVACGDESLASHRLMHALNEMQLFGLCANCRAN